MLKGKVALVTGGSRGIGAAIALRLAKAGADVAILYAGNSQAAQATCADIEAQGVRALAVQCDVKDFEAVKAAVAESSSVLSPATASSGSSVPLMVIRAL